ncbi:MAG: hypothetical protein JWR19_299 [Pedosphaera sp.]|nr:hypothetical protein [Pedosphaera sp.]
MIKYLVALCLCLVGLVQAARADVLMVADEFPAMQNLAGKLKSEEHINSKIIGQKDLPDNLVQYEAIIIYIHRVLDAKVEHAFIDYTKAGGKLLVLHHSISSGKRTNDAWFSFLGVDLPPVDYKWIEGVDLTVVSLNPNHFITTNKVVYPLHIPFVKTNAPAVDATLPGFTLIHSEVYLNHVLIGPRTILLGTKYLEPASGVTYMQDRTGWIKPAGKGQIIYLMPGHNAVDFLDPTYSRIVLNAVIYKP